MNSGEQNKLFILIDGHSLAFRAYYAFAKSRSGPLRTSTGIPTSVCFGFLNSLMQLLETQKPTYLAVAFDLAAPSFRHEADVNYKANRQETPEEFRPDLTNLQSLLAAMNIPIVTSPGYEADDVLGTLAKQAGDNGYTVKILTGDRDLFQLVDEEKKTTVLYLDINAVKSTSGQGYTEFNSQAVTEKLGVTPKQVVDFKALCGDKSDNIPGVRGIGEKTAIDLLKKYDNYLALGYTFKIRSIKDNYISLLKKLIFVKHHINFHYDTLIEIIWTIIPSIILIFIAIPSFMLLYSIQILSKMFNCENFQNF
jgi:DNA polymerase-1